MKRALGLIFVIATFIVGFLSIRGTMPFMPIFGSSMEPTLQSGSLMIIEPVDPYKVEVGDIIVYNVPTLIRELYSYPPTVAHRVIKVNRDVGLLSFRTKGDNTGEDPFAIRPGDIKGKVGDQIPYLGLPLLFLQSQQGLIFISVALTLLALFLYSDELNRGGQNMHKLVFSPIIKEGYRTNREIAQKIDATEQRMNSTEMALEKFASAISEYATHLSSHTSAIQGLAEASHELKRSAAEQNRVITRLMENMIPPNMNQPNMAQPEYRTERPEQPKPKKVDVISQVEETILHLEKTMSYPPGCYRSRHDQEPPERTVQKAG